MVYLTLLFSSGDSCDVAVAYVDCDASVACIGFKESVAICFNRVLKTVCIKFLCLYLEDKSVLVKLAGCEHSL